VRVVAVDRHHARRDPRTEQRLDAREAIPIERCIERDATVVAQAKVERGMRERDLRDEIGDVRGLGRLALEELQARGHVVEQIRDLDRGARGCADLGDRDEAPALDLHARAREIVGAARRQRHARDARDCRQCLAAKPHRGDPP